MVLHLCKSTQCGLEGLLCSSQHFPADVDLEGEYDDLARPSSTGRASELSILMCRISEQHCCIEFDSVSRFTGFREFVFSHVELCFFHFPCTVLTFFLTLHHRVQKKKEMRCDKPSVTNLVSRTEVLDEVIQKRRCISADSALVVSAGRFRPTDLNIRRAIDL